jgi:hypothetical protein
VTARTKLDRFILQDIASTFALDNWQCIFESGDRLILLPNLENVYCINPN